MLVNQTTSGTIDPKKQFSKKNLLRVVGCPFKSWFQRRSYLYCAQRRMNGSAASNINSTSCEFSCVVLHHATRQFELCKTLPKKPTFNKMKANHQNKQTNTKQQYILDASFIFQLSTFVVKHVFAQRSMNGSVAAMFAPSAPIPKHAATTAAYDFTKLSPKSGRLTK